MIGFGNTPADPKSPPLIGSRKQRLTLEKSVRPSDKITIEEMRLDLAARVGPYRIHAGMSRKFVLNEGMPAPIVVGKGQFGLPTFVRVEQSAGYLPIYLDLSNQYGGSAYLTTQFAGFMDVIVLAGEVLYATAFQVPGALNLTEIKVTEVII
jgi:hypothetical protein